MGSSTRRWAAAASCAVALALATPALANAQGSAAVSSRQQIGANNLITAGQHASNATSSAPAAAVSRQATPLAAQAFPSSSSTVIGSVGFIDGEQVGYFWSAARGDSVSQTLSGPLKTTKAVLKLDVVTNGLAPTATVDWVLSINGKDVGKFQIVSGQTGPFTAKYTYKKITGGSYAVAIRVTNEVAVGDGAITLRYAGAGPHSIALKK